jgi:hypothetical protein
MSCQKTCGRSDISLTRYDRRDVGKRVLHTVHRIRLLDGAESTRKVLGDLLDVPTDEYIGNALRCQIATDVDTGRTVLKMNIDKCKIRAMRFR